eukprot:gene8634-2897_t
MSPIKGQRSYCSLDGSPVKGQRHQFDASFDGSPMKRRAGRSNGSFQTFDLSEVSGSPVKGSRGIHDWKGSPLKGRRQTFGMSIHDWKGSPVKGRRSSKGSRKMSREHIMDDFGAANSSLGFESFQQQPPMSSLVNATPLSMEGKQNMTTLELATGAIDTGTLDLSFSNMSEVKILQYLSALRTNPNTISIVKLRGNKLNTPAISDLLCE